MGANERTLLHYAEKGLYAGALAIVLMQRPGFTQIGGLLLAVGVGAFYIWIFMEYQSRLSRITGRSMVAKDKLTTRLDVAMGPAIVCALISLVLGLSLVESFSVISKR